MMVIFDRLEEAEWQLLLLTDNRPLVKAYAAKLKERASFHEALEGHRHTTVNAGQLLIQKLKVSSQRFGDMYERCASVNTKSEPK